MTIMWYADAMAHRATARRSAPKEAPLENYGVVMGNRGRLVLPAALRRRLKVGEGDRLVLAIQPDGTVRMASVRQQVRKVAGLFAHVAKGKSLVDELIQERRKEARREERESRREIRREIRR